MEIPTIAIAHWGAVPFHCRRLHFQISIR